MTFWLPGTSVISTSWDWACYMQKWSIFEFEYLPLGSLGTSRNRVARYLMHWFVSALQESQPAFGLIVNVPSKNLVLCVYGSVPIVHGVANADRTDTLSWQSFYSAHTVYWLSCFFFILQDLIEDDVMLLDTYDTVRYLSVPYTCERLI